VTRVSFVSGARAFSFGKNWLRFLDTIDDDKIRSAELSLTEFLGLKNLKGRSFLDVGCGSGLFSLAAFNLGAERIVSFDVDPLAVACCKFLRRRVGSPSKWNVLQGSILDLDFVSTLGTFDVVYSWGVLHHTGRMWISIKHSARLVAERGYYYIAIYNRYDGILGSTFWLRIKRVYNCWPDVGKRILEGIYTTLVFANGLLRSPLHPNLRARGMYWRTDIVDWLGGYPYEFAKIDEILRFVRSNFPDFTLTNIMRANELENNLYLFRKS